MVGGLIAANVLVFGLWRAPALKHMLERLAVHHPYAGRGLPLLGSTFSHQTPDHLFFNMFALGTLGTLRLHSLTLAG